MEQIKYGWLIFIQQFSLLHTFMASVTHQLNAADVKWTMTSIAPYLQEVSYFYRQ